MLKIGGSFLLKNDKPDVSSLREMAQCVKEVLKLPGGERRVVVVVGGGVSARNYIGAADALGANKGLQDHLGVLVSRLNARVFIEALAEAGVDAWPEVPESLQDVRASLAVKRVVVLGGLQPGQSTTAVAALCGEYCRDAKRIIFSTNVDGVYTADPTKNKSARKLVKVSYDRLRELCCGSDNTLPGQYRIMDNVALTVLERTRRLEAVVLEGKKDEIIAAITRDLSKVDKNSRDCGTTICAETLEQAPVDASAAASSVACKCKCGASCACGPNCKCPPLDAPTASAVKKCKCKCGDSCACGDNCKCAPL